MGFLLQIIARGLYIYIYIILKGTLYREIRGVDRNQAQTIDIEKLSYRQGLLFLF